MTDTTTAQPSSTSERDDLVVMLDRHRGFLLQTVQGLTDDQARLRPTVSALSLAGLIKHVSATADHWLDFIENGAPDVGGDTGSNDAAAQAYADMFTLLPDETLEGTLASYAMVSDRAAELARTADLDAVHALPEAPWFAKESWSNRRVLMHIVAETSQHAGHADIIREAIDGQKTMG